MAPIALSPNRTPRLIHIFRVEVERSEYERRTAHDEEIESTELISFQEAARLVVEGGIYISLPSAIIGKYLLENFFLTESWKIRAYPNN